MRCAWVGLALTWGFAVGCDVYDATLVGMGEPDAGPACELVLPPERPDVADGPDVDAVLFAVNQIVLDQSDGSWRTIGYDLDGLCTVRSSPRVECLAPMRSTGPAFDGEGGRDNEYGKSLSGLISSVRPDVLPRAMSGLRQGLGSILLRLENWNGDRDDPRVTVVFMQAVFGSGEAIDEPIDELDVSDGMLHVNGVERSIPQWDGGDYFWVREDAFVDGDPERPENLDNNAFVAGGTIVLRLQNRLPFIFGGDESSVQFSLTDGIVTADISEDGSELTSVTLAGRFPTIDILATIASGGVCPDSGDYQTLSSLLDLSADIRATPGSGGPEATCDALSIGFLFHEGKRATLVGLHPGFGIPTPCDVTDGGMPDAGPTDAGMPDAGPTDAGPTDAG